MKLVTPLLRGIGCAFFLIAAVAASSGQMRRPSITGISHMCVYSSDEAASDHFYAHVVGATKGVDPQDAKGTRYYFSPTQFVEVLPLPAGQTSSRMACVAYNTADAAGLLSYLHRRGVQGLSELRTGGDGSRWFETKDPEGNRVKFLEPGPTPVAVTGKPIATRLIHVGYLVHNREAEDHFYREILGFRPYWYGGMHPGHVDWVSQQVPDGHDWLEYMMVGESPTAPVPRVVDQRELGVLNHFSLGVVNMEQAVTILMREDRLSQRRDGPQMGRDGKWQFNLYDPDGTRVELMEFQPVIKPCCSAFTAESPAN